jgi:hypothetical protein
MEGRERRECAKSKGDKNELKLTDNPFIALLTL